MMKTCRKPSGGLLLALLIASCPIASLCAADTTSPVTSDNREFSKIRLSDRFYCEGATCADINGDGHEDFIAGPYWFEGPTFAEPHAYRSGESRDIDGYSDNFFTFADDFSGDGRVDILVVPMPGENAFWYENPGSSKAHWPRRLAFPAVDNESPGFVDMTGDGKPELLCISQGQFGYVETPDQLTEAVWPFRAISPDLGYERFTHGLGAGDVNNDGRMDVLEKHGWWEQPEDAADNLPWTFHPAPFPNQAGRRCTLPMLMATETRTSSHAKLPMVMGCPGLNTSRKATRSSSMSTESWMITRQKTMRM